MPRKPNSVADQLRKAITAAAKAGTPRMRIADSAGVARSTLTQFVNGDGQLRLDIAERVALSLGKKLSLTDAE